MTYITSKNNKNRSFQLRFGFFSVAYQDESKIVKIKNRENENVKNERKNNKKKIEKNERKNTKIENEKMNRNCKNNKKKINENKIEKGLNIIEKMVLIGSALSGLLSSLRNFLIRRILVV